MALLKVPGVSGWPFELAREEMAVNFPSKGPAPSVFEVPYKRILMLSLYTRAHKSPFPRNIPTTICISFPCVWVGVKGIGTFWFPWFYALFWLGLIVKSVAKTKRGRAGE